jgi:multidrug efflux pump subunit AcrB
MARYLLKPHKGHAHGEDPAGNSSPANGNVLVRFQHGFEHYFERLRNSYRGLLSLALTHPVRVVAGFLGVAALSLCLAPL